MTTYTTFDRAEFTNIVRVWRAAGWLASYGRLDSFGRTVQATNGLRVTMPTWTHKPAANYHRRPVTGATSPYTTVRAIPAGVGTCAECLAPLVRVGADGACANCGSC